MSTPGRDRDRHEGNAAGIRALSTRGDLAGNTTLVNATCDFYLAPLDLRRWTSRKTQTVRPHLHGAEEGPRTGKGDPNVCDSLCTVHPEELCG